MADIILGYFVFNHGKLREENYYLEIIIQPLKLSTRMDIG